MKEKLRDMYESQLIDTTGLLKAIERGWATISDIVEIVGEDNALSVIMTAKLSEISNACNTVIVSGVDITFGEESVHFNLSIEDQSNINNCRVYSAAEIVQIYIAAQTLITSQTTYHNELKQYVQTLTSVEDISAVKYGMTLPEPYLSEMNEKLAVAQQQMQSIVSKMAQTAAAEKA